MNNHFGRLGNEKDRCQNGPVYVQRGAACLSVS